MGLDPYETRIGDSSLVTDLQANELVDKEYKGDPIGWIKKSITTTAKVGTRSGQFACIADDSPKDGQV